MDKSNVIHLPKIMTADSAYMGMLRRITRPFSGQEFAYVPGYEAMSCVWLNMLLQPLRPLLQGWSVRKFFDGIPMPILPIHPAAKRGCINSHQRQTAQLLLYASTLAYIYQNISSCNILSDGTSVSPNADRKGGAKKYIHIKERNAFQ